MGSDFSLARIPLRARALPIEFRHSFLAARVQFRLSTIGESARIIATGAPLFQHVFQQADNAVAALISAKARELHRFAGPTGGR
jgi:hypothetical protein